MEQTGSRNGADVEQDLDYRGNWTGRAFSLPASKGWIRVFSTLLLKTNRGRDLGLISGWNRSFSIARGDGADRK